MEALPSRFWLEVIMASAVPITALAIVVNRTISGEAFGVRQIQFLGLVLMGGLILILGIEDILEKSAVGALVGALAGYLFGSLAKFDERQDGGRQKDERQKDA